MLVAFVLGVLAGGCASAYAAGREDLPLAVGTTWIYKGSAAGRAITVSVRVAAVTVDGDRAVARLEGDIFGLPFGDATATTYWIRRGARLSRSSSAARDGAPWIDGPLAAGKTSCDPEAPKLCWVVEKAEATALAGVRGVEAVARTTWQLVQRDNTGIYWITVASGIGITALRYHHNGSPADADVKLVEMRTR